MKRQRLARLLRETHEAIDFEQPGLKATSETDSVFVRGIYFLRMDDCIPQGPIAKYEIKIRFPMKFPQSEPVVHETGKTIPQCPDYHINSDGTCCIVIWEIWKLSVKKVSIQNYFDGPLKNFFFGQYVKKNTGKWPFGEERHGKTGIIKAFAKRLSCNSNEKEVLDHLQFLLTDEFKNRFPCPCGSRKVSKECCIERLARVKKEIPKQNAREMLLRLKSCD